MTVRRLFPWLVGALSVFCLFSAPRAYGATVAVMPVEGVNLSPGECDAIGVLFANAFSRDANVAVLSPLETKSIRQQSPNAMAAAAQMGVALYAELTAMQLGTTVKLAGTLFNKDGSVVYRAQTVAPSLDAMEMETAKLARALILRQPVAPTAGASYVAPPVIAPPAVEIPPLQEGGSDHYPKALGVKLAMLVPRASARNFSPLVGVAFDGRVGSRDYFFEFGAGFALPVNDNSWSTDLRIGVLSAELGGSYYLNDGSAGLYVGGGILPTLWISQRSYYDQTSATLAAYGQLGVTFTRDSRMRLYSEVRVSQYCLGVADPLVSSSGYGSSREGTTDSYYPLTLAFQMGLGW